MPTATAPTELFRIYNPELEAFWGREEGEVAGTWKWDWISLTNQRAWSEHCVLQNNATFVEVQKKYPVAERLRKI